MDNEIDVIKKRIKSKRNKLNAVSKCDNDKIKYLKNLLSRTLITIILVLISVIYINYSDKNLLQYKEHVFSKNISFAPFKDWYQKQFGDVIPIEVDDPDSTTVFDSELVYTSSEDYYNGVKLSVANNTVITTITSGIVVYVGEKENYGNVVIVQGIDGVDIWYGNITNTNISLYDYVEEKTILGEAKDNYIYFVITKDGEYLNYEKYIEDNKN